MMMDRGSFSALQASLVRSLIILIFFPLVCCRCFCCLLDLIIIVSACTLCNPCSPLVRFKVVGRLAANQHAVYVRQFLSLARLLRRSRFVDDLNGNAQSTSRTLQRIVIELHAARSFRFPRACAAEQARFPQKGANAASCTLWLPVATRCGCIVRF